MAEATDAAKVSAEMLHYLETCAHFYQYSVQNVWLILMACPHASQVAGFQTWKGMNRFVRKGERGIPILAPILITEKDETGAEPPKRFLRGFKVVHVFDVSQTDGEPLPEPPTWANPERNEELQERLIAFARERDITVIEKDLPGEIQGMSKGGAIELSPTAGTSTLIHELAHELLHKHSLQLNISREEKELEAEAVAFSVGRFFGMEMSSSANYIAMWQGDKKTIFEHLELIKSTATLIIQAISA